MRRSFVMALVAALLGVVLGPVAGGAAEGPGSCRGDAEEDRGVGPSGLGGENGESLLASPRSSPRPTPRLPSGPTPARLAEALRLPAPTAGPLPAAPAPRSAAPLGRLRAHASRGPPALAV